MGSDYKLNSSSKKRKVLAHGHLKIMCTYVELLSTYVCTTDYGPSTNEGGGSVGWIVLSHQK